jgi:streptomycin 6-kinase
MTTAGSYRSSPPDPAVVHRIQRAAGHWNLIIGEKLAGGTRSAVYAATDQHRRDLVLKLPQARTMPGDVASVEAAALSGWAATGAAATLVDATSDALLLVRARPGTPWPWHPGESVGDLVGIAADLLTRLWSVEPGSDRYPTLAEVYAADERVAREDAEYERRVRGEPDRGAPGLDRLPAAASAAARLISTVPVTRLLHGDFISKNLVRDHTSAVGWIALDPLPMIGDPACDVAAFAAYQPAELILPIAEALAVMAGVSSTRALTWTAIWTVHQVAQAWREDQQSLERLVESPVIDRLLAA